MIVPCTTCDSVGSLCGRCNDPDGSCNCTFPNSCDCHDCGGSGSIDHKPMTHKTNRTNPPARSPREYEEEIAALTVYRDPAALMADLTAEMEAMLVPCAFCLTYPNTEDIGAIHCGEPSCFQTGIPGCGGHWWNFYNECASEFLIARADAALSPKGEA